jgi:hypothetical protein
MADNYKPLIIGGDYSRLLQCIDDIRALILPVVEAHEAKKKETPTVEDPANAKMIKGALEHGWKYSGMKPYTGMYCVNNLTKEKCNN